MRAKKKSIKTEIFFFLIFFSSVLPSSCSSKLSLFFFFTSSVIFPLSSKKQQTQDKTQKKGTDANVDEIVHTHMRHSDLVNGYKRRNGYSIQSTERSTCNIAIQLETVFGACGGSRNSLPDWFKREC